MRNFIIFLLFLFVFVSISQAQRKKRTSTDNQPNIILIMTDDQGIGDVGYMGNPFVETPHIDALAQNGTKLNNFYVAPVCSPTRASLMTGRDFIKTGVYDTYNGGSIMDDDEVTVAEYLHEKKYTTGIFGKWHLGDHYPFRPIDQGFDEALVHKGGGVGQPGDIFNFYKNDSSYFDPILYKNEVPVQTKGYCSDVYTDGALEFIQQNKDEPFFLYLAFNAPHTPLQVPKKYYDMYDDLEVRYKTNQTNPFMAGEMSDADFEVTRRIYGMVTNIDDNVGRVMETLENLHLTDNTMVIFLTDNGSRGKRYRAGLRGEKSDVYEGGIKVPCIIQYPKLGKRVINDVLAHIDVMPTVLELAGIEADKSKIDGNSFYPLLEGITTTRFDDRSLIFHWQRNFPEPYRNIAVRKGDYKLVAHNSYDATIDDMELFNIAKDPGEQNNVVKNHEPKALELKMEFDNWYKEAISKGEHPIQRIILGSDHQPSTLLNHNDAKGVPAMWRDDDVYGYWDVYVEKDGFYEITSTFLSDLPLNGKMIFKMAPYQRTVDAPKTQTKEIVLEKFYLQKGDYRLENWFINPGESNIFPFSVEVKKAL